MFLLEISIIIDPHRTEGKITDSICNDIAQIIIDVLLPLGFECKRNTHWYHPDEECEMRGIYFQALGIQAGIVVDEFRQLPPLVQIAQALSSLYDKPDVTGHSMEPKINHGDIIALRQCTLNDIQYGEIYAVVLDTIRTIKILRRSPDPDKLRFIPINTNDYDEQEFDKSRIINVFEVIGSISKFF